MKNTVWGVDPLSVGPTSQTTSKLGFLSIIRLDTDDHIVFDMDLKDT